MKYFYSFLTCILIANLISAQKLQDVIYLKNGSVLRGTITETQTDSIIKVEFKDKNIWVFKPAEIEKITREKPLQNNTRFIENKTGYNFIPEIGHFIALKKDADSYFNFGMIHTYNFIPNLSTGMGISLDLGENVYIPIFLDLRYYKNYKHIAPFIIINYGYAIPKENNIDIMNRSLSNQGGFYYAAGLGLEFPQNENFSLQINFLYKYQVNTYKSKAGESYYEIIDENSRFAIKLGLLFL